MSFIQFAVGGGDESELFRCSKQPFLKGLRVSAVGSAPYQAVFKGQPLLEHSCMQ